MDYDTVFTGFFDFCHDDGAFITMGFVEVGEILERVVADDVGIEDKERGGVFSEGFGGELEGAGGAEGFRFDRELDADVVLLFILDFVSQITG